jgi:hypothetical protein
VDELGPSVRGEIESWFVARGLPHFQEGYAAGTDIWTRALPALAVAFVLAVVAATDRDASMSYNVAVVAASGGLLLLAWVLPNVRRHRSPLRVPTHVGRVEIGVVAVGPALVALVLGRPAEALVAGVVGVVAVGGIFLATSYGVVPIVRWALHQIRVLLAGILRLLTRALPLLLVAVTFLFITAEVWEVAGGLTGFAYPVSLGLLFVVGAAFVLTRLPGDLAAVGSFDTWDEVDALAAESPAAALAGRPTRQDPSDVAPLSRRQWVNVALLVLFGQAVQITLLGVAVGGVLTAFGVVALPPDLVERWVGDVDVLVSVTVDGRELALTEQLLRVAGFLAAFSSLAFTVYVATDETYRSEFRSEVVDDSIRTAFAVRLRYVEAGATPENDGGSVSSSVSSRRRGGA